MQEEKGTIVGSMAEATRQNLHVTLYPEQFQKS